MYLPPYTNLNKDFLKAIFKNEKRLFKITEVKQITVPLYEELNVGKLYEHYKGNAQLAPYLPDAYGKGR